MQPCAMCAGPTERRDLRVGQTVGASNYCPQCRVFTADSDGKEPERWARFTSLRLAVVQEVLRRPAPERLRGWPA
ncbi:MAG TPA: hypothetical protein DEQ28_08705 [Clostridiales bacterium]|nr:hypothetical protein [Clostridiales bacterium]